MSASSERNRVLLLWASGKTDIQMSRELTAAALEHYLGRRPSAEELAGEQRLPGQKPHFPAFPDFHYNISHSGGIAVCAVADSPIGIDLQKITDNPVRALKIAKRFFSVQEQDALAKLQAQGDLTELCRLFTRYWTARESYIKLTGRGLAEPFSNFRPDLEAGVIRMQNERPAVSGGQAMIRILNEVSAASGGPVADSTGTAFYLTECQAPEGFCLTVCSFILPNLICRR